MQLDKLYPTSSTTSDGIALTDYLQNIDGFTDSMVDAYLMGYIPADKMPAALMPVYLSGGIGEMSAVYHPKNTGWGYSIMDSTEDRLRCASVTSVNGATVTHPDAKYRLINAAQMARANIGVDITLSVIFAFISDSVYDGNGGTGGFCKGGTDAGGVGSPHSKTFTYTFEEFDNILKNDLPLFTETRTGTYGAASGKTFVYSPKPSDFGDSSDPDVLHKYVFDAGNGCHGELYIYSYTINAQMAYANDNSGTTVHFLRPFAYPNIDTVGDYNATKAMILPGPEETKRLYYTYNTATDAFTLAPDGNYSIAPNSIVDYNIYPGGFNFGTIPGELFTNPAPSAQNTLCIYKNARINVSGYGATISGDIHAIYTPMDIYRHSLLYHKHSTDGTLTSYSTDTWVTKFNNKNVPSGDIVTGELSDIKLDLQPWQYPEIDITVNTFIPKNIPDSSDTGTNLIRFGNITPSAFQFGDISIEKIYFGSTLLYQKYTPDEYVRLIPTDEFTTEKTYADDYRIYGPLPAGDIVLSVRTPRTKNLLPYPYYGVYVGSGGDSWDGAVYYDSLDSSCLILTDHGDGTFEWVNQVTANFKTAIIFEDHRILYPAGTYTMSHASGITYIPQMAARPYDVNGNALGVYHDNNPGRYGTGQVTFTCSVPFYLRTDLYAANSYHYAAGYARPQLEIGNAVTEYEPPNPATLTTITLPRALEEDEYISYQDQKIMPTGTPIVVPKLNTIVGENVIMIENYPRATNTITLTPATKE